VTAAERAARVIARRALRYRRGGDPALDRPAHVRAASALVWVGAELIVVQDDALFLGVVDPATGLVDDLALPAGADRVFDDRRGNKAAKPDFESAIVVAGELIAFGSGGPLPARQVVLRWRPGATPRIVPVPALYAALGAHAAPGGALNLEGAAIAGDRIWLANRGGARDGGAATPDRLLAFPCAALLAALDGAALGAPVAVLDPVLGRAGSVALHLTDLAVRGDALWCLAAAERTDSYFADGEVVGSAIGPIAADGTARLARVVDACGAPIADKLEGLAFDPARPDRAYAVADPDDPDRPGELLELELAG
jgi:hypothetical protein